MLTCLIKSNGRSVRLINIHGILTSRFCLLYLIKILKMAAELYKGVLHLFFVVLPYTLFFCTRYRAVGYTFYTFPLLPGISSHVSYVSVILFFLYVSGIRVMLRAM